MCFAGLEELSKSSAMDELTIKCGVCSNAYKVSAERGGPARVAYFKRSRFICYSKKKSSIHEFLD